MKTELMNALKEAEELGYSGEAFLSLKRFIENAKSKPINEMSGCEQIVAAFEIFNKYTNTKNPTHCEHDIMTVDCHPGDVSEDDIITLDKLGFFVEWDDNDFKSYRFGSC